MSKFASHDVVLLGEFHRLKHDLLFLQALVRRMPEHGVHVLAWEFARRVDQSLLDSLVLGTGWDERLAREVTWRCSVEWGYREYVDVRRAVWERNATLPQGARRIRVLALMNSPKWNLLEREEDEKDEAKWSAVWHGETEADWARAVLDSAVDRGDKVLSYTGLHHAFTHMRQPGVANGMFQGFDTRRYGNLLYNRLGSRTFMVALHAPWPDSTGYGGKWVLPANGAIDRAVAALGPQRTRVGFDIQGSPFALLTSASSVYSRGSHDFRLRDFADGYVYLAALSPAEGVTVIDDFITPENLGASRATFPDVSMRRASIAEFQSSIREGADIAGQMRRRLVTP